MSYGETKAEAFAALLPHIEVRHALRLMAQHQEEAYRDDKAPKRRDLRWATMTALRKLAEVSYVKRLGQDYGE